MTTVLLAGGGTGGHVFPLLAVADAIRAARPGTNIVFVGTARGLEARALPARGEQLELLDVAPLKGQGPRGAIRGVIKAASALPAARALVRRVAPDIVLAAGGYAAGPVSLAARSLGVPVAVLEANRVLGLANHMMTPFAARAYVAYAEVARRFRPSVVRSFGLPLRAGFAPSAYRPEEGRARIVLLGGSQGASALNAALPEAFAAVCREVPNATIVHQAGRGNAVAVKNAYDELCVGERASVVEFVDDVPALLASADVVVARAGAGSVAELCAVGRAAVFVPFPFAADDHQRKNAEALADAGAAVCLAQKDATPGRLAREIADLLRDDARRISIADRARGRGAPNAAEHVARDLLGMLERRRAADAFLTTASALGAPGKPACFAVAYVTCTSSASAASA